MNGWQFLHRNIFPLIIALGIVCMTAIALIDSCAGRRPYSGCQIEIDVAHDGGAKP